MLVSITGVFVPFVESQNRMHFIVRKHARDVASTLSTILQSFIPGGVTLIP